MESEIPPPPSLPPVFSAAKYLDLEPKNLDWMEVIRFMLDKGHSQLMAEKLASLWLWTPDQNPIPPPPSPPPSLVVERLSITTSNKTAFDAIEPLSPHDRTLLNRLLDEDFDSIVDLPKQESSSKAPTRLQAYQRSIVSLENDALDQIERSQEENRHLEWMEKFAKGEDHTTSAKQPRKTVATKGHSTQNLSQGQKEKARKSSFGQLGDLGGRLMNSVRHRKTKLASTLGIDSSVAGVDNPALASALALDSSKKPPPPLTVATGGANDLASDSNAGGRGGGNSRPGRTSAHAHARPDRKSTGSHVVERFSSLAEGSSKGVGKGVDKGVGKGDGKGDGKGAKPGSRPRARSRSASNLVGLKLLRGARSLDGSSATAHGGGGSGERGKRGSHGSGEAMWVTRGEGHGGETRTSPVGADVDMGKVLADQLSTFSKARSNTLHGRGRAKTLKKQKDKEGQER